MAWQSEGPQNNPGAGVVLAQTGPMGAEGVGPRTMPGIIISATVAATIRIEHRNAANAANIQSQVVPVQANQCIVIPSMGSMSPEAGERFRVVNVTAVVGTVQASLFT